MVRSRHNYNLLEVIMKLFKDTTTALRQSIAIGCLTKRYLIEIHSIKANESRFVVISSDLWQLPYKEWSLLKTIEPNR